MLTHPTPTPSALAASHRFWTARQVLNRPTVRRDPVLQGRSAYERISGFELTEPTEITICRQQLGDTILNTDSRNTRIMNHGAAHLGCSYD